MDGERNGAVPGSNNEFPLENFVLQYAEEEKKTPSISFIVYHRNGICNVSCHNSGKYQFSG